jgi:UPF0755 protein
MNDINTAFLKPQAMPDIQSLHDERALPIERVGIRGLRHPLIIRTKSGDMPAVGNFEMKRVLNVHLETDSPYNTYKYAGLPPGPICLPTIAGIDAVLNAEKHGYYYFAARPDGSGYHNFAKTYNQHLNFARQFHKYLNDRKIKN